VCDNYNEPSLRSPYQSERILGKSTKKGMLTMLAWMFRLIKTEIFQKYFSTIESIIESAQISIFSKKSLLVTILKLFPLS